MVVKGPMGYKFLAAAGNKEEAQAWAAAWKKRNGKSVKVKKLGYRNYGIFGYAY